MDEAIPSTPLDYADSLTLLSRMIRRGAQTTGLVALACPPVYRLLLSSGVSQECLPSTEFLLFAIATVVIILASTAYQWHRRRTLTMQLEKAQARLQYLNANLLKPDTQKQQVRIFMDGAFDLLHYGHMNAFRLARSLGTQLIVGVNSDESITECKGAPLMKDQERLTMVNACKFVDEVVPGCPYVMTREYLDYVIEKYKIDYVIHGDDPCLVNGKDVYEAAKQAGKFRTIPRTEGVSTTDIVGRMLLMTKEHHLYNQHDNLKTASSAGDTMVGNQSKFLTTSRMLQLFSAGVKAPTKDMHVVFIDGAWDLFHPGHVAILKAARERGDYLIVGVHSDAVVNRIRGMNLPLMNLHERVLSVLGCRFVDDVLIDAPYEISADMLSRLNISEVVRGSSRSDLGDSQQLDERYRCAKETGAFTVLQSTTDFSIRSIVHRIQRNQTMFQKKFENKMEKERAFYQQKRQANGSRYS